MLQRFASTSSSLLRISLTTCIQRRGRRRTTVAPPWVPPKNEPSINYEVQRSIITPENEEFINAIAKTALPPRRSPLCEQPWERGVWTHKSKRVGLIAIKIGMTPQWLNDGTRMLCTMLHIIDNQVISCIDPETWYRTTLVGKRKAFGRFGPNYKVTVGAEDADPNRLTSEYRRQFEAQGIRPKRFLASFLVSPDAIVEPGTKLVATHFLVGQYISAWGKSIDWGFQGVMHRWGMRGHSGNSPTKAHRRVGSIGATGDARVWPGKRLPGHMGWEWVGNPALEIIRINVDDQVIYVKGNTPGEVGEMILLKDSFVLEWKKRVKNPPFPTHYPNESDQPLPSEIYLPTLFRFNQPTIVYEEAIDDKKKVLRKGGGGKKVVEKKKK